MSRPHRGRRDEEGQTAVLVVGFALVLALLVVVVVDASAAYLRRQRLDALADGAALAAADGIRGEQVYTDGLGERAAIDPALARSYAEAYVREVAARRAYPGLRVAVSTSGDTVRVTARTPLTLPFSPPGFTGRATVTGRAAAQVFVSD